jgi:hypothetical protein
MFAVSQAEVTDLVEKAGGRVLAAREDDLAGKEWISLRYTVGR